MAIRAKAYTASGTTVTHTGAIGFWGYSLRETGGTNPVTITIYDNTAASGTVLATATVAASGFSNEVFPVPVTATTGVTVIISGTGTALAGSVYLG